MYFRLFMYIVHLKIDLIDPNETSKNNTTLVCAYLYIKNKYCVILFSLIFA